MYRSLFVAPIMMSLAALPSHEQGPSRGEAAAARSPATPATPQGGNGALAWYDGSGIRVDFQPFDPGTNIADYPAWSPDGARIAFRGRSQPQAPLGIWVAESDGQDAQQQTFDGGQRPAWSPVGTKIAYIDGANDLCVVNPDGTEQTCLHAGIDWSPTWAPDGSQIAFSSWNGTSYDIYIYDFASGSVSQLTSSPDADEVDISWSPDGTKIAYDGGLSGVEYIFLSDPGNPISLNQGSQSTIPEWSPDGSKIAFTKPGTGGKYDIFTIKPDGSDLINVTQTPDSGEEYFSWQPLFRICSHVANFAMECGPGTPQSGPGARLGGQERSDPRFYRPRGYVVPDPEAFEEAKARANAEVARRRERSAPSGSVLEGVGPQATLVRAWPGVDDPGISPSDSTGAIGPTRYIELVNQQFAIYDRTNDIPLDSGPLSELTGRGSAKLLDPQIMWDPDTRRFYYAAIQGDHDLGPLRWHYLLVGFSMTDTPSTSADFCQYTINYGHTLPDYPKLGDTQDFLLLGVNSYPEGGGFRADVVAITKPAGGSDCPLGSSLRVTVRQGLVNEDGSSAHTPVPANQTDGDPVGWIVGTASSLPGDFISVFKVSTDPDGTPDIAATGAIVNVTPYDMPADAAQPGSDFLIDTMDTRLTQAVSAVDPRFGSVAVWTQHTVNGPFGAEIEWLEIDPDRLLVLQTGRIRFSDTFIFNGAISPDRVVDGPSQAFGSNMVLAFNASSATRQVGIWMVSKIGGGPVTSPTRLIESPGPITDHTCIRRSVCSWGDYASATPDPAAPPLGADGRVWLTSTWNGAPPTTGGVVRWQTMNWAAEP
jgi:dipeptidyl aminopeptidase/acylaminoacyl peptidase